MTNIFIESTPNDGCVNIIANWTSRPTSALDGAWMTLANTEAIYRYSTVASEWVRPIIYNGTMTLLAGITGNDVPSNEGWTDYTTGSSTITQSGGEVIWNSVANTYALSYIDILSDTSTWLLGYFQVDDANDSAFDLAFYRAPDGRMALKLREIGDIQRWDLAQPHARHQSYDFSTERYIEVAIDMDSDYAMMWVDHSPVTACGLPLSAASADGGYTDMRIGRVVNRTGVTRGRGIKVGEY